MGDWRVGVQGLGEKERKEIAVADNIYILI